MERAIIRFTKTHCEVLCSKGHLLEARKLDKTWGGSMFEAEVAEHQEGTYNRFDRAARRCLGCGH